MSQLERGNIGVGLGRVSANLCSIDWDSDAWLTTFLECNPKLSGTLQTRGARGGNIWVRMVGEYPNSTKITAHRVNDKPEPAGEWRADGNQTIISGTHPSGCEYAFLVSAPPVEIRFSEIVWPPGVKPPTSSQKEDHPTQYTQSHMSTQSTQLTHVVDCLSPSTSPLLFDVSRFVPSASGQSDSLLFSMARMLKGTEMTIQRPPTDNEKDALFCEWWNGAKGVVDGSFETFEEKWLRATDTAAVPLGATALDLAWSRASREPFPPETQVTKFGRQMSENLQKLVAFFYQLQLIHGTRPFYVTYRDAAKRLELDHTTVAEWVKLISRPGPWHILRKVSVGSYVARKSNEYLYLPLVGPVSEAPCHAVDGKIGRR